MLPEKRRRHGSRGNHEALDHETTKDQREDERDQQRLEQLDDLDRSLIGLG